MLVEYRLLRTQGATMTEAKSLSLDPPPITLTATDIQNWWHEAASAGDTEVMEVCDRAGNDELLALYQLQDQDNAHQAECRFSANQRDFAW